MSKDTIVTISREYGSGGREIGRIIAHELGIGFFDRELIEMAAEESGVHVNIYEKLDETLANKSLLKLPGSRQIRSLDAVFNYQAEAILKVAHKPCVIVGRCADYVLRGNPNLVRVFFYADREARKRRIIEQYEILPSDADTVLRKVDKERAAYYTYHTDNAWGDMHPFDLCINTSRQDLEAAAKLVVEYVKMKP